MTAAPPQPSGRTVTDRDKRFADRVARISIVGTVMTILGTIVQAVALGVLDLPSILGSSTLLIVIVGLYVAARRQFRVRALARAALYFIASNILLFVALRGGLAGYYAPSLVMLPAICVMALGRRDILAFSAFLGLAVAGLYVFHDALPANAVQGGRDVAGAGAVLLTVLACNIGILYLLVGESEARYDLLERVLAEQVRAANHDSLTGLANRTAVNSFLADLDARPRPLVFHLIDLDGFKAVNDRFGHLVGDEVLVEVADRLRSTHGEAVLIARIGGDEFLVVQENRDNDIDASGAGVARALNGGAPLGRPGAVVTGSVGSARFPQDGETTSSVLSRADRALYDAKSDGKARHAS